MGAAALPRFPLQLALSTNMLRSPERVQVWFLAKPQTMAVICLICYNRLWSREDVPLSCHNCLIQFQWSISFLDDYSWAIWSLEKVYCMFVARCTDTGQRKATAKEDVDRGLSNMIHKHSMCSCCPNFSCTAQHQEISHKIGWSSGFGLDMRLCLARLYLSLFIFSNQGKSRQTVYT